LSSFLVFDNFDILKYQGLLDFAKIIGLYRVILMLQASKARERIFEGRSSEENRLT
jgi:hypothetical protein